MKGLGTWTVFPPTLSMGLGEVSLILTLSDPNPSSHPTNSTLLLSPVALPTKNNTSNNNVNYHFWGLCAWLYVKRFAHNIIFKTTQSGSSLISFTLREEEREVQRGPVTSLRPHSRSAVYLGSVPACPLSHYLGHRKTYPWHALAEQLSFLFLMCVVWYERKGR